MKRCTNIDSSWKKYTSRPILAALVVAGIAHVNTAHAVLATGDILNITSGTIDANLGTVNGGSYFGMDMNGNSNIATTEKTAITSRNGIPIGIAHTATGSHTGSNNGSETPAFDIWEFFGNTGMDYFTSAVTDGGSGTLGFSGWRVTWNGIAAINMGAAAFQPGNCAALGCTGWVFTDGTARFQSAGTNGAAYTLDYSATVPPGDVSGFGGVRYYLHLVGTITTVGAITSSVGTVTAGSLGATRVGLSTLTAASIPQDNANSAVVHKDGLYYDFVVTGLTGGEQVNVVIPLSVPLPASAIYRKYNAGTGLWATFTEDGSNAVKSAAGTPDACPAPGNVAYTAGLTAGRYCIQLTILNGGANDSGSSVNTIVDPGGIATGPSNVFTDTRSGATGGCSISRNPDNILKRGDWWLVLGFIAWLGMLVRRRQARA